MYDVLSQNIRKEHIEKVGGKLLTFGSFRMGVSGKNSDVDAILVAPRHVYRKDFNYTFLKMLKDRPETSSVNVSSA